MKNLQLMMKIIAKKREKSPSYSFKLTLPIRSKNKNYYSPARLKAELDGGADVKFSPAKPDPSEAKVSTCA